MEKVDYVIEKMLEWKFFQKGWYNLTEEEQEEFKNEIMEKMNEEV